MEDKEKIGRRELISSGALAGLALAFGLLGSNDTASGQGKKSTANPLMDIPQRKKFIEQKATGRKYESLDFQPLLEEITRTNMEIFQTQNVAQNELLDKIKSKNLIPAIDSFKEINKEQDLKFNQNNIEDLLDQASNLLDRGIKDRTEWDNLSIRIFYLEIEINQFLELDRLHQQEISKGYYDQLLNEKLTQLNIERLNKDVLEQISSIFSDMFTKLWDEQKVAEMVDHKAILALLGVGGMDPNNAVSQSAGKVAHFQSQVVAEFEMAIQKVNNFIQDQGYINLIDQTKLKEKLLRSQVDWEEVDRDFRLMRTDIERKYEYIKLTAFKSDDGILNLRKRKNPLKLRFNNDFNEARQRLEAASIGLSNVFGYKNELPAFKGQIDYFDRCILWTREAINWLISTNQMDQSFVINVSLKQLFKIKNNNGLDNLIENGNITINIDEDIFFKEYSHVRLKGASIFVQPSEKRRSKKNDSAMNYEGIIQCEITIPSRSYYRYSDGSTKEIDQSYIPKVKLNRIASRNFIRQPDIVGTTLFNNLSPIGKWNLFFPQTVDGQFSEKLDVNDIQLDLFITARRNK